MKKNIWQIAESMVEGVARKNASPSLPGYKRPTDFGKATEVIKSIETKYPDSIGPSKDGKDLILALCDQFGVGGPTDRHDDDFHQIELILSRIINRGND